MGMLLPEDGDADLSSLLAATGMSYDEISGFCAVVGAALERRHDRARALALRLWRTSHFQLRWAPEIRRFVVRAGPWAPGYPPPTPDDVLYVEAALGLSEDGPARRAWLSELARVASGVAAPSAPPSDVPGTPDSLFRLVYCSRNAISGAPDDVAREIARILAVSRHDNACDGITGALLYDEGCFVQVLEGPLAALERLFERIRRDRRHSDVTVLENASRHERSFASWSMAHASEAPDRRPGEGLQLARAFVARGALTGERVATRLHDLLLRRERSPA